LKKFPFQSIIERASALQADTQPSPFFKKNQETFFIFWYKYKLGTKEWSLGIQVGSLGIQIGFLGIQVGFLGIQVGFLGMQVGSLGMQVGFLGMQEWSS